MSVNAEIEAAELRKKELEEQIKAIDAHLSELRQQKTRELEIRYGLKIGDKYILSAQLRAKLSERNWWTGLRHGGYDPFTIGSLGDDERIYINDSGNWGGTTGVTLAQVRTCQKVEELHATP